MCTMPRAWVEKLMSMISAGCPCPAARFMRRPSAIRYSLRPSFVLYSSMKSRTLSQDTEASCRAGLLISLSKWPTLPMMHPSFMAAMCSAAMTSLQPVTVMTMSAILTASAILMTSRPSILASIAFTGSTSVTMTVAPRPLALMATPFPHHPYPATTSLFPATMRFVAFIHPSKAD